MADAKLFESEDSNSSSLNSDVSAFGEISEEDAASPRAYLQKSQSHEAAVNTKSRANPSDGEHSPSASFNSFLTSYQDKMKDMILTTISEETSQTKALITKEMEGASCMTIHPRSNFKIMWDFMQALVLLWIYIVAPWQASFLQGEVKEERDAYYQNGRLLIVLLDGVADIAILLDFFMSFFVAYYDSEHERTRNLIIRPGATARYFVFGLNKHVPTLSFCIDVAACMPFDSAINMMPLIGDTKDNSTLASYWRLLRLLRVSTIRNLMPVVRKVLMLLGDIWPRVIPFIELMMMFVYISLICHIIACVLYKSGHPGGDEVNCQFRDECGWVSKQQFGYNATSERFTHDINTRYIASLYYGFTILTTVGFGDISANGPNERIMVVILMLLSTFVSGLMVGNVTNVVLAQNLGKEAYRQRYEQCTEYMTFHDIDGTVQERVKRYFHLMYAGSRYYDEASILSGLPEQLQRKILDEMYGDFLDKIPFLPKTVDQLGVEFDALSQEEQHCALEATAIRDQIFKGLQPTMYLPGDVVVAEGTEAGALFMLTSGACKILRDGVVVGLMEEGDHFGALSCLTKSERNATVLASSFSRLARLDGRVMTQLLIDFPDFHDQVMIWAERQSQRLSKSKAMANWVKTRKIGAEIHALGAFASMVDLAAQGDDEKELEVGEYGSGNGHHPEDMEVLNRIHHEDHHDENSAAVVKKLAKEKELKAKAFKTFVNEKKITTETMSDSQQSEVSFEVELVESLRAMEEHILNQSKHMLEMNLVQEQQREQIAQLQYELTRTGGKS